MASFAIIKKSDNTVVQVIRVLNKITYDEKGIEHEDRGIAWMENFLAKGFDYTVFNDKGELEKFHLEPEEMYFKQTFFMADGTDQKKYNYAGIGNTYDDNLKAFIAPMPLEAPLIDTKGMTTQQKIALGSNLSLKGSWQLDEKMRWAFSVDEPIIKGGGILGRMFKTTAPEITEEEVIVKCADDTSKETETPKPQTMNKITSFKAWFNNSDIIALTVATLIFWIIRFNFILSGAMYDITEGWDTVATIIAIIILFGLGYAIPIYLVVAWIRFRKTGKRL